MTLANTGVPLANQPANVTSEISVTYVLKAIWFSRWVFSVIFAVCLGISIYVVIQLPNIYKSSVLLMPNGDSSSLSMPGQLGNLAALAGVDVGGGGNEKTVLALEIMKSKQFIIEFIKAENIKPQIIAAENWNYNTGEIKYALDLYDPKKEQWIREVQHPKKTIPSDLESAEAFLENFTVSEDKTNGMVRLSVKHYSPELARDWLEKIVIKINEKIRFLDAEESSTAISFLNDELEKANNTEIRSMLYSLIEEQTKTLMLSKVKRDYAFSVVDPPIAPELKFKPQRGIMLAIICIVLSILLVAASILRFQLQKGQK
jgi:uncharacterized protein involved in exopolysaccharide biosynthesis